jgi:threonine synthase
VQVVSTRGGDAATLSEAIEAGLARDGGLYQLERPLPRPSGSPRSLELPDVAAWLLTPLFEGEPMLRELPALARRAFTFQAPLRALGERTDLLELFHGPTAAFKDFGARFLAECLAATHRGTHPVTVLVATSGDTGAAVAAAFHRRPGFRVVVLYPDGRVSARQAHQLGAFGDNISTYRVVGSFDDCQRLAKGAFADAALVQATGLTSANSISLGRLLPQVVYWAAAALAAERRHGVPASFVVPTGNLGNAFALLMARELGLPIARVVLATNANKVVPELFASGHYAPRASLATLANAMDVGAPSNAERLLAWWPDPRREAAWLTADAVEDDAIRLRIRATHAAHALAVCPHTACGLEVLTRLRAQGFEGPTVVAATAHPAKFETIVEPLIGTPVHAPPALAELLSRPALSKPLTSDSEALRRALLVET